MPSRLNMLHRMMSAPANSDRHRCNHPSCAHLHTRAEPATPVEAAAALIELSLHESNGPVEELSGALARMAQLVQGRPGDRSDSD